MGINMRKMLSCHSPAVLRVTLLGLLAPSMIMRSIQERVENWASGAMLLWTRKRHGFNIQRFYNIKNIQ